MVFMIFTPFLKYFLAKGWQILERLNNRDSQDKAQSEILHPGAI